MLMLRRYALLAGKEWLASQDEALTRAREAAPGEAAASEMCSTVPRQSRTRGPSRPWIECPMHSLCGALCARQVLKLVVEDATRYQLGKTKVLFRAFLLESLVVSPAISPDDCMLMGLRSSSAPSSLRASRNGAPPPSPSPPSCCRSGGARCCASGATSSRGPARSVSRVPCAGITPSSSHTLAFVPFATYRHI